MHHSGYLSTGIRFISFFMTTIPTNILKNLMSEFRFQMSRSSGAGGQHVNKVSSRVELRFHVSDSEFLSDDQKQIIHERLDNRINFNGELLIVSDATRSQLRNKQDCIERFYRLLAEALKPVKKRIATKPTISSKKVRLETKKKIAVKKQQRRKPEI
jgi:ribosome-associated protein